MAMSKALRAIRITVPLLAAAAFCLWLWRQAVPLSLGMVSALLRDRKSVV